jgi:L-rhamnose isomerase/sugar isomerase
LVDQKALEEARAAQDAVRCQEILQNAFRTDVRPLLRQARLEAGAALHPIEAYRNLGIRKALTAERGEHSIATGL